MRLHSTGLAVLFTMTLLTCNAYALDPAQRQIIVGWTKICAEKYGVDPAFALAVAHVESRKGTQEFRVGRLGRSRYYGPFGINKCFLEKWPVDDLFCNIEVGCKALRGPQARVLRRYNAEWSGSYAQAVRQAQREYGKEK